MVGERPILLLRRSDLRAMEPGSISDKWFRTDRFGQRLLVGRTVMRPKRRWSKCVRSCGKEWKQELLGFLPVPFMRLEVLLRRVNRSEERRVGKERRRR